MEIPAPVDVSRLKAILSGAKNIMNKVETGDYETGHVDPRALTEDGVKELQSEGVTRPVSQMQSNGQQAARDANGMPIYNNFHKSKMPQAIKDAMLNNPIPQINPLALTGTFQLSDVQDMIEKPMPLPSRPKTAPRKAIVENYLPREDDDLITVSRAELSEMIKTELLEFLAGTFTKTLTETAIKKTINTLIKEGKIATKKK